MCGIAGKFNYDPTNVVDRGRLAAMTSVIAHRGPDSDGFFLGAGVGLLVGAAFGAVDAASADRRMSAADLAARDEVNRSQRHPAMLGYRLGF